MILVTGVSGFIGKHLLSALIKQYGADQILALTSHPIDACPYLLHHNYSFNDQYFSESGYDAIQTIIHAGAFTPKNGQQANQWKECNSNIINTGKLLSSHLPNLKKVIYLSTLDVYGADAIITERSPLEPVSLYGASKLYSEKMVTAWANGNNKIHQLLRIGHVYGPGEEAYQKIIPITFKKIINEELIQIWGDGNEIRSYIYIDDVIHAILASLKLEESIGPVNLVSSEAIAIKELVKVMIEISEQNTRVETVPSPIKNRDLIFDNCKMKQFLLPAEVALRDGLLKEWKYMKAV